MAIVVTLNELNRQVVELTKLDGTKILLLTSRIIQMEEVDVSSFFQSTTYGTKVKIPPSEIFTVKEDIEDIKQAIGWNRPSLNEGNV